PDPAGLRAALVGRLPSYMVPAAVIILDALPLTPNRKLDRAALPAPDFGALVTGRAPTTPAEETLAGLFAEILGIASVGRDDDFFALGGHSLLVARLVGRIRTSMDAELSIRAVFDAPTVAGLAGRLGLAGAARLPLLPRPRPERLPLAPVQRGLWFQYRMEGPSPTYNIPLGIRFTGDFDVDALWQAVGDLAARHEPLRTVFPTDHKGDPYQRLLPAGTGPNLRVEPSRGDRLDRRLVRLAARGFDLEREPPLRMLLLELGEREHVLGLVVHHIASDGWSEPQLVDDLLQAYEARHIGSTPDWDPLPVSYADYAQWQHELLGDPADPSSLAAIQLGYWRKALAGLPAELSLPADRPRPLRPDFTGGSVDIDIPPGLHARLRSLAAGCGATMFMVTQAALAALLTGHGAGTDIPVGTQVAGRVDESLDDLVGLFVNTLVLRTDTSGDPTFRQLLARVRERSLAALANADLPFEWLVSDLNPPREAARNPLFQVMLTYHNLANADPGLDDGRAEVVTVTNPSAWFELSLDLNEEAGRDGIEGTLDYRAARFDEATAARLAAGFVALLEAVAADPDQPLSALPDRALRPALLARLFAEVLGREEVGSHDDFFALGGTSLAAARLARHLGVMLGADVPLRAIFDAPTPTRLAVRLAGAQPIPTNSW
ncbi:MAG: condensation domain-containing protein, partial [Acidimicrobiia bacterium]